MKNAAAIARKMLKRDLEAWEREGFDVRKMTPECEWHDRNVCEFVGRQLREQSLADVRRAYESSLRLMIG